MSWPTYWSVLGVVAASCLLLAPLLYIVVRWEVRRAFRPVVQKLDQLAVKLDIMGARVDRLHKRVQGLDKDLPRARGEGPGESKA